jgi:hypothetical protein
MRNMKQLLFSVMIVGTLSGFSSPDASQLPSPSDCPSGHCARSFLAGDGLLAACEGKNIADRNACRGYIVGIADGLSEEDSKIAGWTACIPAKVDMVQVQDAVVDFLRKNPQSRHMTAASQTAHALETAFPCKS